MPLRARPLSLPEDHRSARLPGPCRFLNGRKHQ